MEQKGRVDVYNVQQSGVRVRREQQLVYGGQPFLGLHGRARAAHGRQVVPRAAPVPRLLLLVEPPQQVRAELVGEELVQALSWNRKAMRRNETPAHGCEKQGVQSTKVLCRII